MNNTMKQINIGMFGYGTVGKGLHDVLKQICPENVRIEQVCVLHTEKHQDIGLPITNRPEDIFNNPAVNLIVELISDEEAAYCIVKHALQKGLPVVSGNKKMLANHLEELIEIQERQQVALLYDASACGSIPVIRNLEEYYDNDLLISVKGILNGSSNFILSKVFNENMSYKDALQLAQQLGFAEADPTLDIGGWDTLYKLIIITMHAFGIYIRPEQIFTFGIGNMKECDINFAREKRRRIKVVGCAEKIDSERLSLSVMPQLISRQKYIYSVEDEFNGVVIKGLFYYKQFMFGRGAGGHPTGSAVLSDITAQLYRYKYEYKKRNSLRKPTFTNDFTFRIYYRYTHKEDLRLISFVNIEESYNSANNNYIVGTVTMAELLQKADTLRKADIFLAAYPLD